MDVKLMNIRHSNFSDSKVEAFIDILYHGLLLQGFKIVNGSNGRFLSYPREKGKDDKWYDRIKPDSLAFKQEFEETVLREYDKFE